VKNHPNGFIGALVEGKRGVGKSSYCIKVMKEIYQTLLSCDDTTAYQYALKHILFDMDDIIRILREARNQNEVLPVVCWDDAGVHGSNLQWFINMRGIQELKSVMDTVRTAVTGLLLNCPDREGLAKVLRGYDDYLVSIIKVNPPYERSARGYNIYKLPSGTRRVYRNFEDRYSCYLPNWVYKEYMLERMKYLDVALKTVLQVFLKKTYKFFCNKFIYKSIKTFCLFHKKNTIYLYLCTILS